MPCWKSPIAPVLQIILRKLWTTFGLDAAAKDLPMADVEERIRTFKPDLTVVYATTPSIACDLDHAKMARPHG